MDNPDAHAAQPVDCLRCRHFQITWEADHPRGCRAMGFKTALWPWQEVLRSSGSPCMKFEAKPGAKGQKSSEENSAGSATPGHFSRRV
ncbi:MAG: hypothetical protein H7834_16545 [Magnetococcus sp. YQC-9]